MKEAIKDCGGKAQGSSCSEKWSDSRYIVKVDKQYLLMNKLWDVRKIEESNMAVMSPDFYVTHLSYIFPLKLFLCSIQSRSQAD